jgi:hypothetical protein
LTFGELNIEYWGQILIAIIFLSDRSVKAKIDMIRKENECHYFLSGSSKFENSIEDTLRIPNFKCMSIGCSFVSVLSDLFYDEIF